MCLQSLIRQNRVKLNNVDITPWPDNFGYKAYFETVLTRSKTVQENALFTEGCYRDTPGSMNDLTIGNDGYENKALLTRVRHFAPVPLDPVDPQHPPRINWHTFSGRAGLIGKLPYDLDTLPTGIPPGVEMIFELTLQTSDFYLMVDPDHCGENPIVYVEEAELIIMVRDFAPDSYTRFMDLLKEQPCLQNFTQRRMYEYAVDTGRSRVVVTQAFVGQNLPTRCIMALTTTKAFQGSKDTNPYYFGRKFGEGEGTFTLVKIEFNINNNHCDGWTTSSDDVRLNAYMEYKRFLWLTMQADSPYYSTDINFYAFSEKGVFNHYRKP